MLDVLKKHFGYDTFRPLQEEIVTYCVSGKDALVLMPTGGGKSLCFQMPALLFPGLTLVISPLIALMKDQVDALRANGIEAAFINSTLPPAEVAQIERKATRGELKLLYIAPERLGMPQVLAYLKTLQVSLLAVDEAHCISEWGHDFRPDYRNLHVLRTVFPGVPMIALTATANARVRQDIVSQLQLDQGRIFQSSFNRPNLTYRVIPKKRALDRLLAEIQARPGQSVIVYCFSRKGAEKVAADLRANGIQAAAYHAGLLPQERTQIQDRFIRDETPVIAATIAFGMGIDKPDVRLVVHMDLPKSVEGYYQETGRAGRDGLPSDCLLFYSGGDRFKHEFFIREMADSMERQRARFQLQEITRYCEEHSCRRAFLLKYFDEVWEATNCKTCDVCLPPEPARTAIAIKKGVKDVEEFDQTLFEKLRTLRRGLAAAKHVPPYIVFGDRTLQEMSRLYPQRLESLSGIFGVGKEKLAQYGGRFVQAIREYAEAHGIIEQTITGERTVQQPVTMKRASSDTVLTTVELLHKKQTLEQIAAARGLSVTTIVQHLEKAMEQGVALDVAHVVFSSTERLEKIADAFQKSGSDLLAPVRGRLGEAYSYDELRLARLILKARG